MNLKMQELELQFLPFSKIDELGAGMYKGQKISMKDRSIKN